MTVVIRRLSTKVDQLRRTAHAGLRTQAQLERICMQNLLASTEERIFFKDLQSRFVLVSEGGAE